MVGVAGAVRSMTVGGLLLAVAACRPDPSIKIRTVDTGTAGNTTTSLVTSSGVGLVTVDDVALSSGYVDDAFGTWKRGRAAVAADFDGDGDVDVFVGNPGDTSYLLMNVSEGGEIRFEPGQVLSQGEVMWGGTAGDADNDGDIDLYVTIGGNERGGDGLDYFFRNDGTGTLVDKSRVSGVWPRDKEGEPVAGYHASAFFWDIDNDGFLDLFTNHHVTPGSLVDSLVRDDVLGINGILQSDGVGGFVDRSVDLSMRQQWSSRSSTAFDIDNDGDLDLYENNWIGPNILWRNDQAEGELGFTNITDVASLAGGDMGFPGDRNSQAAVPFDFNQDGWEDLFVFRYAEEREPDEPLVHAKGHLLWINMQGQGFVEVAEHTGVNVGFTRPERSHGVEIGVMGCQVADLNADGIGDLFMGYGSPDLPASNELMVSTGLTTVSIDGVGEVVVPRFESWAELIDTPSPASVQRHDADHSHFPYRTHGSLFADFDGDGLYELGAHNGGPFWLEPEIAQEPNRLFRFTFEQPPHWLRLQLQGDGEVVARDAIGTRARARVIDPDGTEREVFGTRRSATGFGAQNDSDLFLGLGPAVEVLELELTWPGGLVTTVTPPEVDERIVVAYEP